MSEIENSAGNPFAPPVAQVQDAAPMTGDLAGRGARFAASMIDGIVFFVVLMVVMFSSSVSMGQLGSDDKTAGFWAVYGVVTLLFLVVQGWLLAKRGQTIGKIAMKIRIVRTDRSPAGFWRLVALRMVPMWFIGFVPFIGPLVAVVDLLLIFRASRRCLHDDIADTIVIRA